MTPDSENLRCAEFLGETLCGPAPRTTSWCSGLRQCGCLLRMFACSACLLAPHVCLLSIFLFRMFICFAWSLASHMCLLRKFFCSAYPLAPHVCIPESPRGVLKAHFYASRKSASKPILVPIAPTQIKFQIQLIKKAPTKPNVL